MEQPAFSRRCPHSRRETLHFNLEELASSQITETSTAVRICTLVKHCSPLRIKFLYLTYRRAEKQHSSGRRVRMRKERQETVTKEVRPSMVFPERESIPGPADLRSALPTSRHQPVHSQCNSRPVSATAIPTTLSTIPACQKARRPESRVIEVTTSAISRNTSPRS
jgi:hypothetical protein